MVGQQGINKVEEEGQHHDSQACKIDPNRKEYNGSEKDYLALSLLKADLMA